MSRLKLLYVTDVNKPGHKPEGGWWYVISGEYHIVTGKRHARQKNARKELETIAAYTPDCANVQLK